MSTDLPKAYLSAITVTNIYQSFYLQYGGKKSTGIDMEQNYVTATVCIDRFGNRRHDRNDHMPTVQCSGWQAVSRACRFAWMAPTRVGSNSSVASWQRDSYSAQIIDNVYSMYTIMHRKKQFT